MVGVMHSIHGYAQQFTERKRSKKKEERPVTDLFSSSNGHYLKSGLRWSEQPGPPHSRDGRYLKNE